MKIDYSVIYSQRKRITITVERDRSVVVRAPEGTSSERILEVVEARKLWLFEKLRHPQKYNGVPHPPGKELVNGESMLYLGRNYQVEIVDEDGDTIQFAQKFLIPKCLTDQKQEVFREWYIQKAREKILPRVPKFAKSLGVTYNQAKINDTKYRWGSCTPKNNLYYNWRLIKASMFVIDYVIVHELAHLLEANHTPRFWNIIRAQIADMDKAKLWLKEHGDILEVDV